MHARSETTAPDDPTGQANEAVDERDIGPLWWPGSGLLRHGVRPAIDWRTALWHGDICWVEGRDGDGNTIIANSADDFIYVAPGNTYGGESPGDVLRSDAGPHANATTPNADTVSAGDLLRDGESGGSGVSMAPVHSDPRSGASTLLHPDPEGGMRLGWQGGCVNAGRLDVDTH